MRVHSTGPKYGPEGDAPSARDVQANEMHSKSACPCTSLKIVRFIPEPPFPQWKHFNSLAVSDAKCGKGDHELLTVMTTRQLTILLTNESRSNSNSNCNCKIDWFTRCTVGLLCQPGPFPSEMDNISNNNHINSSCDHLLVPA